MVDHGLLVRKGEIGDQERCRHHDGRDVHAGAQELHKGSCTGQDRIGSHHMELGIAEALPSPDGIADAAGRGDDVHQKHQRVQKSSLELPFLHVEYGFRYGIRNNGSRHEDRRQQHDDDGPEIAPFQALGHRQTVENHEDRERKAHQEEDRDHHIAQYSGYGIRMAYHHGGEDFKDRVGAGEQNSYSKQSILQDRHLLSAEEVEKYHQKEQ